MEKRETPNNIETVLNNIGKDLCNLSDEELSSAGLDEQTLKMVSRLAQTERERRRRLQAEGIAAAQAKGIRCGRKPIETPSNFETILNEYDAGEISLETALRLSGMGTTTFYNRRREYRRLKAEKADKTL